MRIARAWVLSLAPLLAFSPARAEREAERLAMVEEITATGSGETRVSDARVLDAMRSVPRHLFVPPGERSRAYENRPLSIGHGQTISQPYIVAVMTQLLDVDPGMKVLEIGTGSGYQAAVLAEVTDRVYTIEIIVPLAKSVARRLDELAIEGVVTREGDGYYGWKEEAPFDRIVVTAAAEHVPPPLVAQLRPGGRMVIPVGSKWGAQTLMRVDKDENGRVTTESLLPVRFVPLTGGHAD